MSNILKLNWERRQEHIPVDRVKEQKLLAPFSNKKIKNLLLLSHGCANTNYKIILENNDAYILRVYVREKDAFYREIALSSLLNGKAPIPEIYYKNDTCDETPHPFVIMEYMEGSLMREIILKGDSNAVADCAFSAGQCLNQIRRIPYNQSGFFDKDLNVIPFAKKEEYLAYLQSCLTNSDVQSALGGVLVEKLNSLSSDNVNCLPDQDKANLVHADFDSSNLLVRKINNQYEVSAILDWEFAFAGSYFFDIGLFLRYSHKLSEVYERKFMEGLTDESNLLPPNWKKSAKLLDIISMLSILSSETSIARPNLTQDIISLLNHTVKYWGEF